MSLAPLSSRIKPFRVYSFIMTADLINKVDHYTAVGPFTRTALAHFLERCGVPRILPYRAVAFRAADRLLQKCKAAKLIEKGGKRRTWQRCNGSTLLAEPTTQSFELTRAELQHVIKKVSEELCDDGIAMLASHLLGVDCSMRFSAEDGEDVVFICTPNKEYGGALDSTT